MVNVGSDPWGFAGGVDVEYGLTDAWALRGSLEGSTRSVSADKQAGTAAGSEHTDAALVGVTYTIDVLRLVPYATLQFGVAQIGGPLAAPVTMFASELGVGGDYYLTRQLRAGLSFQYLYRPQDLFQNPRGARKRAVHFLRDCALRVGLLAAAATAPGGAVFFWRCARRARRMGVPSKP